MSITITYQVHRLPLGRVQHLAQAGVSMEVVVTFALKVCEGVIARRRCLRDLLRSLLSTGTLSTGLVVTSRRGEWLWGVGEVTFDEPVGCRGVSSD